MTEAIRPGAPAHNDMVGWRILQAPSALDFLHTEARDVAPLPAGDAIWLTGSPLPDKWRTVPIAEDAAVPLRVAVTAQHGQSGVTACQSLSAFVFTGTPTAASVYAGSLQAIAALPTDGARTEPVLLPERRGLHAVTSSGSFELDGRRIRVRYRTYVQGSDDPRQGVAVAEVIVIDAEVYLRLGNDVGALSTATKNAFTRHVGLTADDHAGAVTAHRERTEAEHARGPVLTDEQRRFLSTALAMWGGVASRKQLPLQALGFDDAADFDAATTTWNRQLEQDETPRFSTLDWTRILLLTEISFASDIWGAGVEFEIVSAWRDPEALSLLRGLQRHLARHIDRSLLGTDSKS